jgi:Uma2 family endonuclease
MTSTLIRDRDLSRRLIRERHRMGCNQHDEVWDEVYVLAPMPDLKHQDLVEEFTSILRDVVKVPKLGRVQPGANVSDRRTNWKKNYRVPDVLVVLNGGRAVDCKTHWMGGPDFLVEIESPDEDISEKVVFYAKIGVRELLVVHRESRVMMLYRLQNDELELVGRSTPRSSSWLSSEVLPLEFRTRHERGQPRIDARRTDAQQQQWTIP